ncbi:MAG: riboflavin synthase [Vulcanimicrobiaceae bacterium]
MFSGLVSYRGTVVERVDARGGNTLRVRCEGVAQERPNVKDSIAVNGACLTAARIEGEDIWFDIVPETLMRSDLGALKPGDLVNLEYSLRLGERLGGHFVYGHVDGTAAVLSRTPEGQGERVRIERPEALHRAICEKAYVAVDGVSLTVAKTGPGWFEVTVIPETLARTTIGHRLAGSLVNLEIDPFARYALAAMENR